MERKILTLENSNRVEKINGEWYGVWYGTNAEGNKVKVYLWIIMAYQEDTGLYHSYSGKLPDSP